MEYSENRKKEELLQQMRRQALKKPEQEDCTDAGVSHTGTFGIRLALAGVLLLTVIWMDREDKSFAGLSMEQVLSYITEVDYGTCIETWIETAVNDSQALL